MEMNWRIRWSYRSYISKLLCQKRHCLFSMKWRWKDGPANYSRSSLFEFLECEYLWKLNSVNISQAGKSNWSLYDSLLKYVPCERRVKHLITQCQTGCLRFCLCLNTLTQASILSTDVDDDTCEVLEASLKTHERNHFCPLSKYRYNQHTIFPLLLWGILYVPRSFQELSLLRVGKAEVLR